MNKTEKAEVVTEIKDLISKSNSVYLVDYDGVNVEDISTIRSEFRKNGVTYKVFKNRLFKQAMQGMERYEKLNDLLVGMTGIAVSDENFVAPAKIIKKYFDKTGKFQFKGCYIESDFFSADNLDRLSSMPIKEEIISNIIGSISSPASGIVGVLNTVIANLISVIDEIGKQKAA